ncbi:MAG TPA: BTAD domain-containing putative transcriptional regulator [Streptosporangiaceae bacterium]|nr:BTAD domain-containing putative transcriptional regulator [Streptosporangiaceae bacterium]
MVECRLLGVVEIVVNGELADLGHPRQQAVLAVLLAELNRVVSIESLVDRVWGYNPPTTARNTLYAHVARLRRALPASAGILLSRRGPGYIVEADPEVVDLYRFRRLAADARAADDDRAANGLFAEALGLWRGPAFAGLASPWLDGLRVAADDEFLAVTVSHNDVRLRLGQHLELLGDLRRLTAAHPLDERLVGQLVLAAYRSGYRAEALDQYHQMRTRLSDELGVGPGPQLRCRYEQVLRDDPVLAGPVPQHPRATGQVPAQLPHELSDFTGRHAELEALRALFADTGPANAIALISAIDGLPGVGKTALAVKFAHEVGGAFPDGQLHIDLRGFDPERGPVRADDALGYLLRGIGVPPEQVPLELDDKVGLYRSLLAEKRILIVLDNAATTDQVRPLLPGRGGTLTLVTSRNRLSGLVARDGARRITLGVLSTSEAAELLRRVVGHSRVSAEPDSASELARLCGHLPLALRLAAERAASCPSLSLSALADELMTERHRLDVLAVDDPASSMRAVFWWSYRQLPPAAARMFRILSLHPGPDISLHGAAALSGTPLTLARQQLGALTNTHLIEQDAPGRYHFHDLLRVYAAELALAEEPAQERRLAMRRVIGWYLHTADVAGRALVPQRRHPAFEPLDPSCTPLGLASHSEALEWCDAERANLVAVACQAHQIGSHQAAWKLPIMLWGYFTLRKPWADWLAMLQTGLEAAHQIGDMHGECAIVNNLGVLYNDRHQPTVAMTYYQRALELSRETGDSYAEVTAFNNLSSVCRNLARLSEASDYASQALLLARKIEDRWGECWAQNTLGEICCDSKRFEDALNHTRQALVLSREIGHRHDEGSALHTLGETNWRCHRFEAAQADLEQALAIRREISDRQGTAHTLTVLGEVMQHTGRAEEARHYWQEAVAIHEDLGEAQAAQLRARLAEL